MNAPLDVLGLPFPLFLSEAKSRLPSGSGIAREVYAGAFSKGAIITEGTGISDASSRSWKTVFRAGILDIEMLTGEDGETGRTEKALLKAEDGELIECVNVPMRNPSRRGEGKTRSTICVSSQAGCRMGCAFCATGKSGFRRNLGAEEIVAQIVTARSRLGWDPANVVFMGMGEPLDNFDEVARAIAVITDPAGLCISQERVTVCTSGIPGGIGKLKNLGLKRLGLSLSLNAGLDATRTIIMPVNTRLGIAGLLEEAKAYPARANFALGVNYCLMPGINDSKAEAVAAAAFCRAAGRSVLNLIPYNPGPWPIASAPTESETERFAALLLEAGAFVKRRETKGRGIMASCGQLRGESLTLP